MNPIITIIVPCYNSQATIKDCVDSVLSSSGNYELLLIDDGSTDQTKEICDSYASTDSRVRAFHKENGGYASAVNFGLNNARGTYVMMLGSDDALTNNIIGHLLNEIRNEQPEVLAFRTKRTDSKRDCSEGIRKYIHVDHTSFADTERTYPDESAILALRDTAKCWKLTLNRDLRYTGKYGIDADGTWSILMCIHASSFSFLPVEGYLWTISSSSLSTKARSLDMRKDILWNWHSFYRSFIIDYPQGKEWPLCVIKYTEHYKTVVFDWILSDGASPMDFVPFRKVLPILRANGMTWTWKNRISFCFKSLYRLRHRKQKQHNSMDSQER